MALRHPKPTVEQNAGRLVRRAAQILEDRNWIQGDVGNGQRGMCARGAICFAVSGNTNFVSVPDVTYQAEVRFSHWLVRTGAMRDVIAEYALHDNITIVPSWNDAKGRTKEEVVQYMRKFADEVDPQLK
jgi:hypothetical protein